MLSTSSPIHPCAPAFPFSHLPSLINDLIQNAGFLHLLPPASHINTQSTSFSLSLVTKSGQPNWYESVKLEGCYNAKFKLSFICQGKPTKLFSYRQPQSFTAWWTTCYIGWHNLPGEQLVTSAGTIYASQKCVATILVPKMLDQISVRFSPMKQWTRFVQLDLKVTKIQNNTL